MSRSTYLRRLVATTLVLLAGAAPLSAQNADAVGAEAAQLFTQAQPHLEAVLGAKLPRTPQFRGTTAEQLLTRPDPELVAYLRWQFPHLTGDTFRSTLQVARYLAVSAAVVERVEGSDVIDVLPPGHRQGIAGWDADLKGVTEPAFLQLALVHETAHWLLEQRYDLPARRKATADGDEYHALQALVEGRAQWLTGQVAQRLGTAQYAPLLAQRYLRARRSAPTGPCAASQKALRQRHWAYVNGLAFFNHLEQSGVKDAEQLAFTRPPKQLNALQRPDLYVRALSSARGDLGAALSRVQAALPAAEWSAMQQPWTASMVGQVAALLGERAQADKVLAGWDEGRSLVWLRKTNAGQYVMVSVARHQTKAAAGLYFEFVVALQRKRDGAANCGLGFRVLEAKSSAATVPGADAAVRTDKRIEYAAGTPPVAVTTLLVRAGDLVFECSWTGVAADLDWAGGVVAAVLADAAR